MAASIEEAAKLFNAGKLQEADNICKKLLLENELNPVALHLRGVIAFNLKKYSEAIDHLKKASTLSVNNIPIMHALAASYQSNLDNDEALKLYRSICQLNPHSWEMQLQLVNSLEANNLLHEAEKTLYNIYTSSPDNIEIMFKLVHILIKLSKYTEAKNIIEAHLNKDSSNAKAWNLLGIIHLHNNNIEDAESSLTNALSMEPDYQDALLNIASLLQDKGDYKKAKQYYKQAISLSDAIPPEISKAHYNLALIELGQCNFSQAWEDLYHRPKKFNDLPQLTSLHNKRILITGEEGLGDELMFLRFIPLLHEYNVTIGYLTNPKLKPLINGFNHIKNVYSPGEDIPPYDYYVSIMDLPKILGISNPNSIEPIKLEATASLNNPVIDQISTSKKPLLGITWRAGTLELNIEADKYLTKSIPLDVMCKVLSNFNGTIIVLQRNLHEKELDTIKNNVKADVIDASVFNDDLALMLPLLDKLDNYIGVSNTNIHLLASLGKKCGIIIPHPGEWRWTFSEPSSPWYPSFKLIKQTEKSQWETVIQQSQQYLEVK